MILYCRDENKEEDVLPGQIDIFEEDKEGNLEINEDLID